MLLRRSAIAAIAAIAIAGTATAGIILILEYYRWPSAPATTCEQQVGHAEIHLANQPRQWAFLDPEDRAVNHYFVNGVRTSGPIFDPPDGTGSQTYSGFVHDADAFPFHFEFRLETLSDSQPVYESALAATCTGEGSTSSVIVNWLPGQSARFYRWAFAPAVTCLPVGEDVQLRFASQPVAWKDPVASLAFDIVYLKNGGEIATGPFAIPSEEGSLVYGALATTNATYPIHYAVRLDTKAGATVVYQSVLVGSCTADGPGTSSVFNVPEPGAAALALGAIGAIGCVATRRRRSARARS